MRAIFIDATARTVTEIDHDGTLRGMYEAIGCGTVELVRLPHSADLWIDEEGAINGTPHGFSIAGYQISGNGLILSSDAEGESAPATVPIKIIADRVRFFTVAADAEA